MVKKLIARSGQIFSKLFFCLRVAAGPRSFLRLVVNSKRLDRYQRYHKMGDGGAAVGGRVGSAEAGVPYAIRYLSQRRIIFLRTYAGDIRIFYEIFWERVYRLPRGFLRDDAVIVDAGANIGMTALFFSLVYPRARIYCIEPDAENMRMLKQNLAASLAGAVVPIEAALNDRDGVVSLGGEGWAYNLSIGVEGGRSVAAMSVETLIRQFGLERIDLLKLDIEGAEEGLFREEPGWLDRVETIIMEIHSVQGIALIRGRLQEKGFFVRVWRPELGDSLFLASKKAIP